MKTYLMANLLAVTLLISTSYESVAQETLISNVLNSATPSLNIRYVDMDVITEDYVMAIEYRNWATATSDSMKIVVEQKYKEVQKLEATIQSKLNNNKYTSRQAYDKDVKKLQDKATDVQVLEKKLSEDFQRESTYRMQQLQDSITSYINEYNLTHRYDAILYKSAGIIFNPSLNITDEILKGLNERCQKPKEIKILLPEGEVQIHKAEDNRILY